MYTTMAQTTAETLGIDSSLVTVKLGDSDLPNAPVSGGSQSNCIGFSCGAGCSNASVAQDRPDGQR
jgi:xanthine dehydrogenase YagR molybdenum-binding subunit